MKEESHANLGETIVGLGETFATQYGTENESIDIPVPPESMKLNELSDFIMKSGLDESFSKSKFHLYVDKGLVDRGTKTKSNQAVYSPRHYYQYLFVSNLAKSISLERIAPILKWIKEYVKQNGGKEEDETAVIKMYLDFRDSTNIVFKKMLPDINRAIVERIFSEEGDLDQQTIIQIFEPVFMLFLCLIGSSAFVEQLSNIIESPEKQTKEEAIR